MVVNVNLRKCPNENKNNMRLLLLDEIRCQNYAWYSTLWSEITMVSQRETRRQNHAWYSTWG